MDENTIWVPLGDRVLVLRAETKTEEDGIALPEGAQILPSHGVVKRVGPGRVDEQGNRCPMEVREGDSVCFARNLGAELEENGVKYLMVNERDILGIKKARPVLAAN